MAGKWLETASQALGDDWISISPAAWIIDQMWGVGIALAGSMTMNFPETEETLVEDLREIGPSVILASSGFWENLASDIRLNIEYSGFVNRWIYRHAQKVGARVLDLESKGEPVEIGLKVLKLLFYQMVLQLSSMKYLFPDLKRE